MEATTSKKTAKATAGFFILVLGIAGMFFEQTKGISAFLIGLGAGVIASV